MLRQNNKTFEIKIIKKFSLKHMKLSMLYCTVPNNALENIQLK